MATTPATYDIVSLYERVSDAYTKKRSKIDSIQEEINSLTKRKETELSLMIKHEVANLEIQKQIEASIIKRNHASHQLTRLEYSLKHLDIWEIINEIAAYETNKEKAKKSFEDLAKGLYTPKHPFSVVYEEVLDNK